MSFAIMLALEFPVGHDSQPMHPVVTIALRAARSAAETLIHASDRPDRIQLLNDDGLQPETNIEHDIEKSLIYLLQKAYPDHGIRSTLSGDRPGRDQSHWWLITPLDGVSNFVRGYPQFAVSVALQVNDRVNHAVVVQPMLGEEYTASRGGGAQLNKSRMRVSRREALLQAFVGLAPAGLGEQSETQLQSALMDRLQPFSAQLRQSGCPTLDLVHTACGKLDAGWLGNFDRQALAAPLLILQEAGALVSDESANPSLLGRELVYGTPRCYKQLIQIRQSLAQTLRSAGSATTE